MLNLTQDYPLEIQERQLSFGLDAVGDEIEEPFGTRPNDLPLDALCAAIERDLREALGEADLPPLPQPSNFQLT
jgi:putative membrane protein